MMRRPPLRNSVRSPQNGRPAPQVAGLPGFNRQRPIGIYARRLSKPKPPRRPWLQFDSDGFFAFAVVATMLFGAAMFGTASAVAISAMTVIFIIVRLSQLREILAPRAFILLIPIFAVFSFLWSQYPVDTLKYSLEFAVTVGIGLLLSAAPYPKAVLWGLFLAFASYVLAAFAFGQTVDVGTSGQTAFSGLTLGKNLMGDIAANATLVSLACVVAAMEDRRPFRAVIALAVTVFEMYVMLEARSAGALLGMVPAVLALIFSLALRPARLAMRLIATVFMSCAAAFMAIAYGSDIVQDSMTLFDKDPTLTGRTYLWQRAADFIAEKPVLGTGFNGFWVQGNPDAEGLWRFAGISDRMGFSFHNTLIELLVNVGWVGVFVFAVVAIASSVLLVRRVMMRPSLTLCFWLSLLVYEFVRMPVEAIGTGPFAYGTVLLFAGFGVALPARRTAAARLAARRVSHYQMRLPRGVFQRGVARPSRFSV